MKRPLPHILLPLLTTLLAALALVPLDAHAQRDTLPDRQLFPNAASDDANIDADLSTDVNATDTIAERLRTLQSLYSAGKYSDALQLSQSIHDNCHLSKNQNLLRLKYTVAAYKDLAYHREADSAARLFWQKDPFYDPNNDPDAPVPFSEIMDNYYTKPKFSLWVAAGKTTAKPRLDTVRIIIDTVQRKPEYDIQGYSAQIGFEYRPLKILSISVAPSFNAYKMNRTSKRSDISTFYYKEDFQIISMPLGMEVALFSKSRFFVPSAYTGVQAKYLIHSKYTAYEAANGVFTKIPDKVENTTLKTRFNAALFGGIKLNFNKGRITYFGDIGVSYDILPYNDPNKLFDNYSLIYDKTHIPDVFHLLEYTYKIGVKVNLQYKIIAKYDYGH